jgi:hypothetical protein
MQTTHKVGVGPCMAGYLMALVEHSPIITSARYATEIPKIYHAHLIMFVQGRVGSSIAPFPLLTPVTKNVAMALYLLSKSSKSPVKVNGPSSKVRETWPSQSFSASVLLSTLAATYPA